MSDENNVKYAIEIKGLKKEYGNKTAVDSISLKVKEKGIFSLLGVNGAGKTTTIKMLTGLAKPTSGEAYILGYGINEEIDKVKALVNISPQDTSVAPNLTVRENLEFIAEIYGMKKDMAVRKTDEIIECFSLKEVENSRAKTLSGGWQRRLSIAMAIITEPKILFLDEPTLGLDVLARNDLWKILNELKKKMTIILTTHYMEEAEELSDEVAVIIGGKIRANGTVEELKALTGKENLEKAFIAIAEGEDLREMESEI